MNKLFYGIRHNSHLYKSLTPVPLQVIDLLVMLLKQQLDGAIDQVHLTRVFKGAYEVLYTYMIGNSRKNALYFAKYIDFFQTQICVKGEIGLNVAQMIVELIRDNRKIVDRISKEQIAMFVGLLQQQKVFINDSFHLISFFSHGEKNLIIWKE